MCSLDLVQQSLLLIVLFNVYSKCIEEEVRTENQGCMQGFRQNIMGKNRTSHGRITLLPDQQRYTLLQGRTVDWR